MRSRVPNVRSWFLCCFLVTLSAIAQSPLRGQELPSSVLAAETDRRLATQVDRHCGGMPLRISLLDGQFLEGRCDGTVTDSLYLSLGSEEIQDRFAFRDIDKVWVPNNGRVQQSARVGGALGAITGVVFILMLDAALCEAVAGCAGLDLMAGGAATGGALGALLGAGVGQLRRPWRLVYDRPSD